MASMYHTILSAPKGDYGPLVQALAFYEKEHEDARKELKTEGRRIEEISSRIPGVTEYRYGQLQEVEAILGYMELLAERAHTEAKQNLMTNHNRALTDRQATQYALADDTVFELKLLCIEVSLVRNKFLGLFKGLDCLNYQLSNCTKLRVAGIEDAEL